MGYINPTNDPVRDWDRYCEKVEEYKETRPVCEYCGEPIMDDYYFDIPLDKEGQTIICEECLVDTYRCWIDD